MAMMGSSPANSTASSVGLEEGAYFQMSSQGSIGGGSGAGSLDLGAIATSPGSRDQLDSAMGESIERFSTSRVLVEIRSEREIKSFPCFDIRKASICVDFIVLYNNRFCRQE